MSTIDQVRSSLVDSQLLTAGAASQSFAKWKTQAGAEATAESFVDWLVQEELLTEFQGEAILEGHTGPFMLGPYEVREQLTVGTLGGVFRAVHNEFDQPVSLKVFPSSLKNDPEKFARIGREMRILIELDHPNVARSYQVGRVGEICYLAMEDLHGETLDSRLERKEWLRFQQACRIVRDVAKGLMHLHQNEVIHRDLRPENIWLGDDGTPKIMEFGAARDAFADIDGDSLGIEVTTAQTIIGQFDYMAPEQARDTRDADHRSDIYALGSILYHCLTGRPPFVEKNQVKQVMKLAAEPPEPASHLVEDLPKQIDETLNGMLAKRPEGRFQTADQVVYALDQYVPPEEEPEHVEVVDVSSAYLKWARGQHPQTSDVIAEDAVGITPQLTEFLGWLTTKQTRRRKMKR